MATIYYLSATGNSLYAAKTIAKKLSIIESTTLLSIPEANKYNLLKPHGTVGFVMPLHFFSLPFLIEEFLTKLDLSDAEYTFAIITCGFHYISNAFHDLKKIIAKSHGTLNGSFYTDMISIYLPLNNIPSESRKQKKLSVANKKLYYIADKIISHSDFHASEYFNLISKTIHSLYKQHPEKLDEKFTINQQCTNCGLCTRICPVKNIVITDGHPVWQHNCTQCLACLHICPSQIIELGNNTKGRKRYRHPQITIKELLPY
ncbi:EFR1 family ferrodoxin [Pectinatus sottacetonis]|uniref:EFR1 family ferrodoxin n=1 Tax=Pectinatus sottacetonis TaxID=1002795 RepID=UPI0018C7426C|nr:EFR1 family ferrodoxin [Pectinatus sottacetonis]